MILQGRILYNLKQKVPELEYDHKYKFVTNHPYSILLDIKLGEHGFTLHHMGKRIYVRRLTEKEIKDREDQEFLEFKSGNWGGKQDDSN